MRKLILETQVSIDGYIAGVDGKTDWMIWNWGTKWSWDAKLRHYHNELTTSADCILLSKQMAEEGFKAHWQQVATNPNDPQYEFAKHITDTYKFVFSKTLNKDTSIPGGWENTDIVVRDFIPFIKKLKSQKGKNILVYGGATFVSSLIEADLIDEYHLLTNPVALGKGLSIFKYLKPLQLIKAIPFECGVVAMHYSKIG